MKLSSILLVLTIFWTLILASQFGNDPGRQPVLDIGSDDPIERVAGQNGVFQDQTEALLHDPEEQSSSNIRLTRNERRNEPLWSAVLLGFYTDILLNGLFIGLLYALQSNVVKSCGFNPLTAIADCAPSVHDKVVLFSKIFLPLTAASFLAFFGSLYPPLFNDRSTPRYRVWILTSGMEAIIWLALMVVVVNITCIPENALSVGDLTTMLPAALIARGFSLALTHLIALLVYILL